MICIQKTKGSTTWFSSPRTQWHWCGMIRWLKMYHPEDRWLQHRKSVARMGPQRQYLYLHWTLALNIGTYKKNHTFFYSKSTQRFSFGISVMSHSWILKVVEQSRPRKCFIFWSAKLLTFLDSLSSKKKKLNVMMFRWAIFGIFYWTIMIQMDTNGFGSIVH